MKDSNRRFKVDSIENSSPMDIQLILEKYGLTDKTEYFSNLLEWHVIVDGEGNKIENFLKKFELISLVKSIKTNYATIRIYEDNDGVAVISVNTGDYLELFCRQILLENLILKNGSSENVIKQIVKTEGKYVSEKKEDVSIESFLGGFILTTPKQSFHCDSWEALSDIVLNLFESWDNLE